MARDVRREPRGHWVLLVLGSIVLAAGLMLQGFAGGVLTAPQRDNFDAEAPSGVAGGGTVFNLSGDEVRSLSAPDHTIVLTFDDGPDPVWTPRILDVLKKHGVRATFFVTGTQMVKHADLVEREIREGHEVGSHTYTHIDMANSSPWRRSFELGLTQRALAGIAGIKTRLIRLPYSSVSDSMHLAEYEAAAQAGRQGYAVVYTDLDSRDWTRPGVASILRAATPPDDLGGVVTLHDSGGDRSQTVQAVDLLITRLQAKGYRVATLSEAFGLPGTTVPASAAERAVGRGLVDAQRSSSVAEDVLRVTFLVVFALTVARLVLSLALSLVHVRKVRKERGKAGEKTDGKAGEKAGDTGPWGDTGPPPVSVVVPAYNEELSLAATVRSLIDTDYPAPVEVIVVDDGSVDDTPAIGARLEAVHPNVRLITGPNGGKASALNSGIRQASHDVLVLVDGDTVFQRDTIGKLVVQLADPRVGAVSGNTKVANRKGLIGRWQHLEYVMGFNLDRRMFDVLQCMSTVPGAIGAFRRRALLSAGGLSSDTLAEDTDLTMAIGRAGWRIVYEETAIAWTEAPSSLRQLWRQRYRWCYGTLQSMWKHKGSVTEHGASGRYGRRCLSFLTVFQVILPLLAPAIDVYALYGLFVLDAEMAATAWLAFAAAQMVAAALALRLDHERITPIWMLPIQLIVYRVLMNLVLIQSVVTAVLGSRLGWQVIHRTGTFAEAAGGADPGALPAEARSRP